jgi:DNA-binding beta-propeller fold protein YncE
MYLGVWPHTVLVLDAAQGQILDKIDLPTDVARTLVLSPDKTTLYASTVRDNSIVTIDLATRKATGSFPLNTGNTNYRLGGLAIDPEGKVLYSIATPIVKQIDRFEVNPPEFVTIDLAAKKITRMVSFR